MSDKVHRKTLKSLGQAQHFSGEFFAVRLREFKVEGRRDRGRPYTR